MCVLYRTGLSGCRKQNRHVSLILEVGIRPAWNLEWNFQRPTSPTPFTTTRWSIQIICATVNELDDMFPDWGEETGPPSSIHFPNEPSSPTFQTAHICHFHFTEMSLQRVRRGTQSLFQNPNTSTNEKQKNQAKQHGSFVSYCTTTNALAYKKNLRKPGNHVRTHVVNARARVSQKYPFSSAMVKVNRQVRICI